MVEEGTAYLVRPSEKVPVSRFKGDPVGLQKCFDLGVKDARDQWEQIKTFLGEDHIGQITTKHFIVKCFVLSLVNMIRYDGVTTHDEINDEWFIHFDGDIIQTCLNDIRCDTW